jgi:transposase
VSGGGIGALEQAMSAALAAPVAEAQPYVQRQPGRNAAERSGREKRQRRGLWISVTPLVTILRRLKTRGAAGAKELLGEGGGFSGRLTLRGITGLIRASVNAVGRI